MLHRDEWQLDADHVADLARPESAGVHDVLGADGALLGLQQPLAVGLLGDRQHPVVLDHLSATLAGSAGVRVGGAVRVEVALVRVEERAGEPGRVDDRHHLGCLVGGEQVRLVVAHVAVPGELGLQPLRALRRAGELDPTGEVQPGALAALLLDGAVHADRVGLQAGDDRVGVDRVEAAGSVPARTCGELAAFDQRDIGESAQREVVQDAAADDAAADHDDAVLVLHRSQTDSVSWRCSCTWR